MYSTGHDAITGMMSKFDVGSKVSKLGSTVAEIEPEAVMTATCVVLSAASNVASMKLPDLTIHKVLASLQRIEESLDQILTEPLNTAIDYFKTVYIFNSTDFFIDLEESDNSQDSLDRY